MQSIIILKTVSVPNMPEFRKDQKVRVSDKIADDLVKMKLAKYDDGEKAVTKTAKAVKAKKEEKNK